MRLTYEQLPRESDKAFAAFSVYLNLGPERSLSATAASLGKSKVLMERWSRKFDWPSRVQAHAIHVATVEREAIEVAARAKATEWQNREQALREEEWEMHEKCIAAAKRGLAAYMEREKVYANLADIARMLEVASKLGRLATGLGDGEKQKSELPQVRVEVTLALEKIYGSETPAQTVEVVEVEAKQIKEGQ